MSARNAGAGQPLTPRSLSWLSVLGSLALHLLPLAFPPAVLAQRALPLRPAGVQLEVLHEPPESRAQPAPVPAAAAAAEPAPPERAAQRSARKRELAPRVATQAPAAAAPAAAAEPAPTPEPSPVAESGAVLPGAEPGAEPAAAAAAAHEQDGASTARAGSAVSQALGSGTGSGAPGAALGSGPPGMPGTSAAELAARRAWYLRQLRERVLARRAYPRLARRAGLEGTVCLRIAVDAAGRLTQLRPTCVAPDSLLEAALHAVRAASPFGPLPSGLGQELVLDLPIVFQLDAG